jgi:hypothetical protein
MAVLNGRRGSAMAWGTALERFEARFRPVLDAARALYDRFFEIVEAQRPLGITGDSFPTPP